MAKVKKVLLIDGPEKEINIFIHGYLAVKNQESFDDLCQKIIAAKPRGKVYLFYWKSGTLTFKWLRTTSHRVGSVADWIPHFTKYRQRAEQLGSRFDSYLKSIPNSKKYPINLIGHSLGARLIHYALANSNLEKYNIKDCIFMGGAADAGDNDWDDCVRKISGKFYNFWSSKDGILKYLPKSQIGSVGISYASSSRIINREYPSFRHTDYWDNLEYLLTRGWRNFKQSKIDMSLTSVDCPIDGSQSLVPLKLDGIYECHGCNGNIEFDDDGSAQHEEVYTFNCPNTDETEYVWESDWEDGRTVRCQECDGQLLIKIADNSDVMVVHELPCESDDSASYVVESEETDDNNWIYYFECPMFGDPVSVGDDPDWIYTCPRCKGDIEIDDDGTVRHEDFYEFICPNTGEPGYVWESDWEDDCEVKCQECKCKVVVKIMKNRDVSVLHEVPNE